MKPNAFYTHCIKDECIGNMALNAQKKCETCAEGTKPNVGNTACVSDGPDNEKKRGKCKDEGYILDPAQGGQDEKTASTVCTLDDSKKCENKSWTAVTRGPRNKVDPKDARLYQPECAKDEDPKFRCKNLKTTYHHMKVVSKGANEKVIKHTCRATRNTKREQKDKFMKRVATAKEQKKPTTSSKKMEARENNRRGRGGICRSLLVGLGAWALTDIEAMSPDEVDGMLEMWPENDIDPKFLDDHMITVGKKPVNAVGGIEPEQAGGLPIIYVIKGIAKLFKIFNKAARAAPPAKSKAFYSDINNAGARSKAPQKSIDAAKKSSIVGKIVKHQGFLDCLAAALVAAKVAGKSK
jgi:hypothetical protein